MDKKDNKKPKVTKEMAQKAFDEYYDSKPTKAGTLRGKILDIKTRKNKVFKEGEKGAEKYLKPTGPARYDFEGIDAFEPGTVVKMKDSSTSTGFREIKTTGKHKKRPDKADEMKGEEARRRVNIRWKKHRDKKQKDIKDIFVSIEGYDYKIKPGVSIHRRKEGTNDKWEKVNVSELEDIVREYLFLEGIKEPSV